MKALTKTGISRWVRNPFPGGMTQNFVISRLIFSSDMEQPDAAHPAVDPRPTLRTIGIPAPMAQLPPAPQHCGTHSCPLMASQHRTLGPQKEKKGKRTSSSFHLFAL